MALYHVNTNLAAAMAQKRNDGAELNKRVRAAGITKEYESELFENVFKLWGGSALDAMIAGQTAFYAALDIAEKTGNIPDALEMAQFGVQRERKYRYSQNAIRAYMARKLNTRAWRQSQGHFD